jgi:YegS/Rv2252/BmrU family lipid kinase
MRCLGILNPAAAHGKTGRIRAAVEAAFQEAGLALRLVTTTHAGHAAELAEQGASEADAVVAIGGDGTVQEVAIGLLSHPHPVPMGVLPQGTGNDFVKMLGMSKDLRLAVRQLSQATPVAVDVGRVTWEDAAGTHTRHFMNAVGAGFDAAAALRSSAYKFLPGIAGYLVAVLRTLAVWQSPEIALFTEKEAPAAYVGPLLLVTAANGVSSGGGFYLTPQASLHDGLFDVCLIEAVSPFRALRMIPSVLRGTHLDAPEVHLLRTPFLYLTARNGLPLHADGELLSQQAHTLTAEVLPKRLHVLMPPKRIL